MRLFERFMELKDNIMIEEKYMVIVTNDSPQQRVLKEVIACDYQWIVKFVETLTFNDEVTLWFFDIDHLRNVGRMIFSSSAVHCLSMNNEISLNDFRKQLIALLDKLQIKRDEESVDK